MREWKRLSSWLPVELKLLVILPVDLLVHVLCLCNARTLARRAHTFSACLRALSSVQRG